MKLRIRIISNGSENTMHPDVDVEKNMRPRGMIMMNKIPRNLIRMKNTLTLSVLMAASVLFTQCDKEPTHTSETDPNSKPVPTDARVAKLSINTQGDAARVFNAAADSLKKESVAGVSVDMSGLSVLEIGGADGDALASAMDNLNTTAKVSKKSMVVNIPTLRVVGNARMPFGVYAKSRMAAPTTKAGTDDGGHSEIEVQDGTLHFSGSVPTSEFLNIKEMAETKATGTDQPVYFTSDTIEVNSDCLTELDQEITNAWQIFDYIKTDNVIVKDSIVHGGRNKQFRGNGKMLLNTTRDGRLTKVKNADRMGVARLNDSDMQYLDLPHFKGQNARMAFDNAPDISGMWTDTIRLGGQWNNNVWTPAADNYGKALYMGNTGNYAMKNADGGHQKNIVVMPAALERIPGVNDSCFYLAPYSGPGSVRPWISSEELINVTEWVPRGAQMTFPVPCVVKVPYMSPYDFFDGAHGQYDWLAYFRDFGFDVTNLETMMVPGLQIYKHTR